LKSFGFAVELPSQAISEDRLQDDADALLMPAIRQQPDHETVNVCAPETGLLLLNVWDRTVKRLSLVSVEMEVCEMEIPPDVDPDTLGNAVETNVVRQNVVTSTVSVPSAATEGTMAPPRK
jgi:hypothetical protein